MNKEYPIEEELEEAYKQIEELTNNWNELEKLLEDFRRLYEGNEFQNNAKFCITVDQVLDKIKEIKENNKI